MPTIDPKAPRPKLSANAVKYYLEADAKAQKAQQRLHGEAKPKAKKPKK